MREYKIQAFGCMEAGHDLVAAGYIALRGTSVIAASKENELRKRFTGQFVRRCQNLYESRGLFKLPGISASREGEKPENPGSSETVREAEAFARRHGAASWCVPGEGGIMAALWDYFDSFHLGFEINLKRLPILQETIEVCEVFDVNPYRLQSEGCLLFTAQNGGDMIASLEKRGDLRSSAREGNGPYRPPDYQWGDPKLFGSPEAR